MSDRLEMLDRLIERKDGQSYTDAIIAIYKKEFILPDEQLEIEQFINNPTRERALILLKKHITTSIIIKNYLNEDDLVAEVTKLIDNEKNRDYLFDIYIDQDLEFLREKIDQTNSKRLSNM